MANKLIKNILVGVGNIYTNPTYGVTYDSSAFVDAGYTIDGVEITYTPELIDIKVDQLGDAAKLVENSTKVMIKTTLAEATLENLAISWGYADASVVTDNTAHTKTFSMGVNATGIPVERSLKFVGKSPDGLARTYICRRVVSANGNSHAYKRGEATTYPTEFRVLPESSLTGAEYGTVVDSLP